MALVARLSRLYYLSSCEYPALFPGYSSHAMRLPFLTLGLIVLQTWALPNVLRKPGQLEGKPPLVLPTAASMSTEKAALQLDYLARVALSVATDNLQHKGCTKEKLRLRRNWRTFSDREKRDYIKSVRCLQKLPARTPATLAPGAKTRYDDFVATHINQTLGIH